MVYRMLKKKEQKENKKKEMNLHKKSDLYCMKPRKS